MAKRPKSAANLGKTLSSLSSRIDALNRERREVAAEIRQVIDAAGAMLADLGATTGGARTRARKRIVAPKAGGGRQVSAKARARMAAAARRRWARYRKEKAAGTS